MKTPGSQLKVSVMAALKNRSLKIILRTNSFLLVLLCCSYLSFGGAITIDPTPPADGTVGQAYTATFNLAVGSDMVSPVTWAINAADLPALAAVGLGFNAAAHSITTVGTGTGVLTTATDVIFRVQAVNTTGGADEHQFTLHINRLPVDIVLVLDKSGSMDLTSGSSSVTRWNALIGAVGLFMSDLEAVDLPGDKIGLTFFDNSFVPPPTGFPTNLISTTGSSAAVNGNFSGPMKVSPGGSTAFGDGLSNGLGKIPFAADRHRFIIAFTDGEQNVPTTTFVNVGAGNHVFLGTNQFSTQPIKIYPIGIGTGGSLPAVLNDITQSEEGSKQVQINTEDGTALSGNYSSNFLNSLSDILKDGSPQIVDVKRGNFNKPVGGGGIKVAGAATGNLFDDEQSFTINKRVNKLVFNLVSNTAGFFNIVSVMKDSVELIQYGRTDAGLGYKTFALDLNYGELPSFKHEGKWTIKVRSSSQDLYEISLLADDHITKYNFSSGTNRVEVGSPISLSAKINYSFKPVENATMQAIILKPGDDLGDLLATTPSKGTADTTSDPSNPGAKKYLELIKDSTFLQKLLAKEQVVTLSYNAADSTYKGQFTNTDVSGVYQVIFKLTTPDDSLHGELVRYQKNSLYVYFPQVDLSKSAINLISTADSTIFTFRPVGINGKFIGPGWGNTIKFDSTSLQVQNITDNGDGSYTIQLKGSASEPVKISIGGQVIYSGVLSGVTSTGGTGGEILKAWWFWLILIIIIIIIWMVSRKKKTP